MGRAGDRGSARGAIEVSIVVIAQKLVRIVCAISTYLKEIHGCGVVDEPYTLDVVVR